MKITEFIKTAGAVAIQAQENDKEETKRYIKGILAKQGEEIEDLKVDVDGDMIRLTGKCKDPSTLEKAILIAGNITGISKVASDGLQFIGKEIKASKGKFYTIKSGDNLSKIAKEFLGDGNKYMDIVKANKGIIDDPDKIYPGQTIRIP